MRKYYLKALFFMIGSMMVIGCATPKAPKVFQPVKFQTDLYLPKVNNFIVILDASKSMDFTYGRTSKFKLARDTVSRMNQTIPELKFTCGLRTFGHSPYVSRMKTQLFYGIAGYSTAGFGKGLQKVTDAGGHSPLYLAIQAANKDLQSLQGKSALIILSDGDKDDLDHAAALKAVKSIKGQFGPRICVYTIFVGNNRAGKGLMEKLAKAGQCGFMVNADSLISSKAMGDFVRKVFLAKDSDRDGVPDTEDKCPNTPRGVKVDKDGCPLDTDGDGVPDYLDKCPGTPKGVKVDKDGCPLDTDGDGVPDYLDRCPGTPKGANVNAKGCWVIENLLFDTDKYNIKPQYNSILDEVISIIRKNPNVKLQIQGHTDNIASAKYNQRLSERRANSVMNYLTEKGISKARLSAVGYGLTRPIATNLTPEGRTLNRRVQINPVR